MVSARQVAKWGGMVWVALLSPSGLWAQGTRIDTILITVDDPFTQKQAAGSFFFRTMNSLHVTTHEPVIRRQLLLSVGEPFDGTLAAETERNIRSLQIFREVTVDTLRLEDGRLALSVQTQDGWTTKPKIGFQAATDGTITYNLGATELNLLGTGTLAHLSYRKDVDRNALEAATKFDRILGSAIDADGYVQWLSDGFVAKWDAGDRFRALTDRNELTIGGEYADQRILQYRASSSTLDTTAYDRKAFLALVTGGVGISSSAEQYLRVGANLQVRQEQFVLRDAGLTDVPDSVSAAVGAWVAWRRARYITMNRFNGLGEEDIDASLYVLARIILAPASFGYQSTGVGPDITLQGTLPFPNGFATAHLSGHAIVGAGADSGAVELRVTGGYKPAARHATILHVQAGVMEGQTPGGEYDLGFNVPPRTWSPHSFVGTRSVWGTLEHKWFLFDALFGLFGAAVAGFVDYGGAWYEHEDPRFGGNVGIGLRAGSALGSVARTGRIDLGWQFGDSFTGESGPVLTIGMGWVFGGGRDPTCVPDVYHVRYRCRPREN